MLAEDLLESGQLAVSEERCGEAITFLSKRLTACEGQQDETLALSRWLAQVLHL